MVPASFQSQRALETLNVAAVGLALAAVVAAAFTDTFGADTSSLITGVPTWILGTVWAWALRVPKTVGNTTFRWGWVASMPLAILNAGIAFGLVCATGQGHFPHSFLYGFFMGATFGAILWLPSLMGTLVCFGVPIAWAQRLAKKGLAGEERGEWIVGLACVAMSVLGLLISLSIAARGSAVGFAGVYVTRGFALLGALAGATSTGLAVAREARRRRFVADAEAGKIEGYRVDPTEEGKVLVRVVAQGKGYRVADFEEDVFDLDAEGEAKQAKHVGRGAVP